LKFVSDLDTKYFAQDQTRDEAKKPRNFKEIESAVKKYLDAKKTLDEVSAVVTEPPLSAEELA
jgi:hypothetical protein